MRRSAGPAGAASRTPPRKASAGVASPAGAPSEAALIAAAVAAGKITRCPPAYLAPVAGAAQLPPLPDYDAAASAAAGEKVRQRMRHRWKGQS